MVDYLSCIGAALSLSSGDIFIRVPCAQTVQPCIVKLSLVAGHEAGYSDGIKGIASQVVVKYAGSNDPFKDFVLKDSVMTRRGSNIARESIKGYISTKLQETIIVTYTIDENGDPVDIKVTGPEHPHPQLARESIIIISNSPKWNAAEVNGKKTASKMQASFAWQF